MVMCAVALLFIQALCDLALPDYMADIVNTGVMNGDSWFIVKTGAVMMGVSVVGMIASIVVGYFAAMIAASVSRDLRSAVFKKVTAFSGAEFDKFSTASLITRTTNDITQVQSVLVMMVRLMFYAPILGVGGIIKAISSSASMTWVIGVAVICLMGLIGVIFAIAIPRFKLLQNLIDRLNLVARENIEGMLVIRAFNTQKFEEKRFDKANKDLTENSLFINRLMSGLMPVMMLIMNLTTVVIVYVGAHHVSDLTMDIGDMMAYMQYAMQIIMAFLMMSMMFIMVPRASVSAERIAEVLETEETVLDPEEAATSPVGSEAVKTIHPEITFNDVSFAYPGGSDKVLRKLNFTAKAGETTAIIGSTGSGKSTLVNLLLRYYDVTEGTIRIGDVDIRDMKKKALRSHIGFVPQKSVLFSGTIASNLNYADKSATQEIIDKAASIAQATEIIASKEEGMEAPIAQGGSNVSGGQKQRLSIARALVKNAPIYIFDDSFSALDLKTDRNLRAALKKELGDSTILLVAQRISTIKDAEQIIVLENGAIAGIGTHDELMHQCEVYQEIARSQLSEEELSR